MQNFIEICLFILRYWAKMHFGHESRAITMLFLNGIIPLAIPYHSSTIPMSMQCIHKTLLKFVYSFSRYWPKMHFEHKSRAITLLFLNEIIPLAISYHSSPIPMSMQSLKKISKKGTKVRARKRSAKHFWHTSRAITLLFQNEINPLAIPYHFSPIPISTQSLNRSKGTKVLPQVPVYQIKYCEKYLKFKGKRIVQKPTENWDVDETYWPESSW